MPTPPALTPPGSGRVTLYHRPGCHLCDQVRPVLHEQAAAAGTSVAEVDITGDTELTERYGELVPVTLVDGRMHDYWRIDPARLAAALAGPADR